MAGLVEFVITEGLKKTGSVALSLAGIANPVGLAITVTEGVKAWVDGYDEDCLVDAKKQLACTHLDLLSIGMGGPIEAMVDYFTKNNGGMCFRFRGVYIVHLFSGFEVRKISCTDVCRWSERDRLWHVDSKYRGLVAGCPVCGMNKT